MRRLFDTILAIREYVVLAVCIVLSLILISFNDSPQIRAIRSVTVVALGFVQDVADFLPDYFGLGEENRILRRQNLTLSEELSRLREASIENERLRLLLGLKQSSPFAYIPANVVGKNFQLFSNSVTLDAGKTDGVRVDMPVVTHSGLAGRIIACGEHYSVAQTLFHKEMRTSAKVLRSRVDGILGWDGGTYLRLNNVAKTLDVQAGDQIVTSEYSSLFPPDILIGVVVKTSEATGDLFQTIEVAPAADLLRFEEVFIVTYVPDSARVILEQQALR
jgi:rod shape-determining protein MreC